MISRCKLVLLDFLMITSIVYLFNKFNSMHKNPIFLTERRSDAISLLLNLNITCNLVSFGRQNRDKLVIFSIYSS